MKVVLDIEQVIDFLLKSILFIYLGDDFCDRPNELGDVYETYYKYFVVDRYRYNTKDILNKERKYSNLSSD